MTDKLDLYQKRMQTQSVKPLNGAIANGIPYQGSGLREEEHR
jgi:hypothetical protein